MSKKPLKIYIEESDEHKLKIKAEQLGFIGRGSLSRYISKVAREPICFIDENVRAMLKALNLK